MGIEEQLKNNGWTPISGSVYVENVRSGKWERYDNAYRLVSPDGKAVYRPGTGKLTSFAADEHMVIEP